MQILRSRACPGCFCVPAQDGAEKDRDEAAWSQIHGFRAAAEPNLEALSLAYVSDNILSSRMHI